jgi:hypothetical protein
VVSKANQYAKDHGKTPFCVYQGNWSVLDRSFERDIIPMARSEGLALAPWGVLAAGKIRTNAEEARRKESGEKGRMVFTLTGNAHLSRKRCATCSRRSGRNWVRRASHRVSEDACCKRQKIWLGLTNMDKQLRSRTTSKSSPTCSRSSVAEKWNSCTRISGRWTLL